MTDADGEALGKDQIGRLGERLARLFLRREGGRILAVNYRAPQGGEVDIVCRDADVLVFVEVKTRRSEFFGRPAAAVNAAKRKLIVRGAVDWLRQIDFPDIYFRFDIVEVLLREGLPPELERIADAFPLPDNYYYPGGGRGAAG